MGPGITLGVYLKAISSSTSLLLLLLLHFRVGIIAGASAESLSPVEQKCDRVVTVESPGVLSYLGNVTFRVPEPFQGRWTTVIKFTSPFTFIGSWGVEVHSYGRKAYATFKINKDVQLQNGDQAIFQFRVLYGLNVKVPKVLSIRWEDQSICGPPILSIPANPIEDQRLESSSSESEDNDNSEGSLEQHITTNNVRIPS